MTPTSLRLRLLRPLLVFSLVTAMSGLATSATARTEQVSGHDHATHDHGAPDVPAITADEPLETVRGGPECTAIGGLKLPDLRMALIKDLVIRDPFDDPGEPPFPKGTKLLRFTTVVMNVGAGPFEVKGSRPNTTQATMSTRQKLYRTAQPGGTATNCQIRETPAIARYSGDGHNHWHIQRMQRFQLLSTGKEEVRLRGYKTGFCFFDGLVRNPNLPGYSSEVKFPYHGCGLSPNATSIRMGLSIGWGDIYPWNIAHQWIDITDLPDGDYRLCATVDPFRHYSEGDRTNNQVYSDISISGMATADPQVTTSARAWASCSS